MASSGNSSLREHLNWYGGFWERLNDITKTVIKEGTLSSQNQPRCPSNVSHRERSRAQRPISYICFLRREWLQPLTPAHLLHCTHNLRSSATDLALPRPKTEYLKHTFSYSGAKLWNSLPYYIKEANSVISFKSGIALSTSDISYDSVLKISNCYLAASYILLQILFCISSIVSCFRTLFCILAFRILFRILISNVF